MKKTHDISITQQVSESITLEIVGSDGSPRDLSSFVFKLDCKKNYSDQSALFSLSSSDSSIMLDTNNNHMVHLVFSHDLTKTLDFDKGVYDLLAYKPDKSHVEVLISGSISLRKTVTKLD